jgi:hypothetical protein
MLFFHAFCHQTVCLPLEITGCAYLVTIKGKIVIEFFKFVFSPLDGQEIGLALNKRILSTLKTLLRLIGPEVCQNNVFASASVSNVSKKEDGIFVVFEGLFVFLFVRFCFFVSRVFFKYINQSPFLLVY